MSDSFFNFEDLIQNAFLNEAREKTDPATFLDLQFSVIEAQKCQNIRQTKFLTFKEALETKKEIYFNELKKKTSQALIDREKSFNNYFFKLMSLYFGNQVATFPAEYGNYQSIKDYNWWKYYSSSKPFNDLVNSRIRQSLECSHIGTVDHFKGERLYYKKYPNPSIGFEKLTGGWPFVLASLQPKSMKRMWANFSLLLKYAFPSVCEYEKCPEKYYYMIDFMENVPFPSPELMDAATKKACMYGEQEYFEDSLEIIDKLNEINNNSYEKEHYYLDPPRDDFGIHPDELNQPGQATYYGMPDVNWSYSKSLMISKYLELSNWPDPRATVKYSNYPNNAKIYKRHSLTQFWWWPRPRDGFSYCAKIGFINPLYFTLDSLKLIRTPYAFSLVIEEKIRRARARARRRSSGGIFGSFVRGISEAASYAVKGDIWRAVGISIGATAQALNPMVIKNNIFRNTPVLKDIYRETENLTGGLLAQMERVSNILPRYIMGEAITERDLLEAVDLGIKAFAIASTGGTAASIIGVSASTLQRGSWGQDDLGSILLSLGEVSAIAYASGAPFKEAVDEFAQRQVVDIAKRETYNRSNLDESIFGTLAVELGASTGRRIYKGETVIDAIKGSADKSTRIALARTSPEMALIVTVATEVEKNGIDHYIPSGMSFSSPSGWFDNFSWERLGKDISDFIKNIDVQDAKRLTGLTVMVAAGKISGDDALRFIGQEIAVRQIDRFYNNEPVTKSSALENQKFIEMNKQVQKVKMEQHLMQKINSGQIPSPYEMQVLVDSDTANWAYSSIADVVPAEEQGHAWSMMFDIGFPQWHMDGFDVDVPEWAKLGKVDMPAWAQISGKEEWNKKLQASYQKKKQGMIDNATWNNMLHEYLVSLWPPHVPLRPMGARPGEYNFIGTDGHVYVRKPLDFSYQHPMIAKGLIEKKYNKKQLAYMDARKKELEDAARIYKKITGESLELPQGGMA